MRYVALLRGINVNPGTQIDMADLRGLLEGLGYTAVRTHLRSGNAVFTAERQPREQIEQAIRDRLRLPVAVMVRTADELRAVVEHNPLEVREPAKFGVVFLAAPPDREELEAIDPAAYAPEVMRLGERELYIDFPNGLARPKLPPLLEKRSKNAGTMRNWNTVTKLLELVETP
ncbi:DUF1697 domain-containing protein [Nonomuraea africana]|uniref:Uncharacterized protein (DUF1697 family) n=1 Tax=Nonomuraea africana TaxID=46171 RepID=A0ABR9K8S2_9ACTN|nr:DUF1697 domain-containing protein [Nonomuraea africana]MBE1557967.1 uncharacterized protein (DUF1697 family) [Nonomuraea africana]